MEMSVGETDIRQIVEGWPGNGLEAISTSRVRRQFPGSTQAITLPLPYHSTTMMLPS